MQGRRTEDGREGGERGGKVEDNPLALVVGRNTGKRRKDGGTEKGQRDGETERDGGRLEARGRGNERKEGGTDGGGRGGRREA